MTKGFKVPCATFTPPGRVDSNRSDLEPQLRAVTPTLTPTGFKIVLDPSVTDAATLGSSALMGADTRRRLSVRAGGRSVCSKRNVCSCTLRGMESSLTPRQQRFAEEYLVDFNKTQAAIRAGYSASRARVTGCELVTNRNVADVIAAGLDEMAEHAQVNAADIERVAWAIASDEEVHPGARVSALNLLAKRTGGFVERREVAVNGDVSVIRNTPSTS